MDTPYRFLHLNENSSVYEANVEMLSFAFVRNPLERVASAYYNKLIKDWSNQTKHYGFKAIRNEIIKTFRQENPYPTNVNPTPEEFVKYILQKVELNGILSLHDHIRPLWTLCPFCSLRFDVIGHLENFTQDSTFIFENMNIDVCIVRFT